MKLKKAKIFLAAAILLFGLTACSKNKPDETEAQNTTASTVAATAENLPAPDESKSEPQETTTSQTPRKPVLADEYGLSYENFPRIDGSTSTIPLEGGLRAMLFDLPQLDAEMQVNHTKTHTAFQRLLDGEADVILSVPLSKEQERLAEDMGVEIELIPIAVEGFVFVVNADNPVSTLTQEQLRGIYSGEITNWKEVGGNDAEIIAYQRNNDSGSQNHMVEFMGDTPLSEPRIELIQAGMEGLMDSVAVYDNSVDAIGYSVFSYAAQMYSRTVNVKFIAVDGIPVSLETLEDKTYPLPSVTYMMYRKDAPADSPVLKLAEFVKSERGSEAIRGAGYVPINN